MRRLIVNADDLGLTCGVNRAIVEAHGHGIVTSATLMADSGAFEDAISQIQKTPALSVGCHIVLIDGKPLLKSSQVTSLVAGTNANNFCDSFTAFASRAIRRKFDPAQVEAEATAQFRKLQQAGVNVSHFDTHKHTHMFSTILRPLLAAAQECGVRAVRNPFAPFRSVVFGHLARNPTLWSRFGQVSALRTMAKRFRRMVGESGIRTTDGTFGVLGTGALNQSLFESIVACIPEGTWEFVCHPGYNDRDLDTVRTRLRQSRVEELKVLTSICARDTLIRHGIELISYRDLLAGS